MTDKALNITLAQLNPIVGDVGYNLEKIKKTFREVPESTDLIVYPELAICGYPPEDLVINPSFLDQTEQAIFDLVEESKNKKAHMIISTPWRIDGEIYNAVHLIGNGQILATQTKYNLPNYGVFDEQRHFTAGSLPDPIEFKGHKLGLVICEDMWTPEVSNHLKDQGAEMLIVTNASPYEVNKSDLRKNHARARVSETGLPLIYVNQCGGQDELVFDGASFILDDKGQTILQAEEFIEDTHHTTWEQTDGKDWHCTTTNIISPLHEGPDAIYQAVMTGLRDYVTKNNFPGVVLGMSGGIDSALSAAIAVDALGKEAVHCVMMPYEYTSQESLEDAEEAANMLGVSYEIIPIKTMVEAAQTALKPHFAKNAPGTAAENLQSRSRALLLMGISNLNGSIVLSTGNKSEMAVGYATLYGDMCGGFNALKDVYKTQVFALSAWRNANKPDHALGPDGPVMPERIITKPPSAELKPDQTDRQTLPDYDDLDDILQCLIEHDMGIDDITARNHTRETAEKIEKMMRGAEYKRRQAPPGVKITQKAFGKDRRYPITNRFTHAPLPKPGQ